MNNNLEFICHRYFLFFWAPAGVCLFLYAIYGYLFLNGEMLACLIMAAMGLFAIFSVTGEAPKLIFSGRTFTINRWLYKTEYDIEEIKSISYITVITDGVNNHDGILIKFKSGKTFKNVCAPEYTKQAQQYVAGKKA
ncbi:hypothetical protein ACQUQU_10165 [Thalassolituus sp. LLYu03]|uniref:hypothetical protein n=1 Tax=Thalassolituus sp. LLYu03 TaxID=3421656 RepID=UPI003D2A502E